VRDPLTVYRGIPSYAAEDFLAVKPGDIIKARGFQSTSKNQSIGNEYVGSKGGVLLKITVPSGTHAIDMSRISRTPRESEVLLDHTISYRIKSVTGNVVNTEVI